MAGMTQQQQQKPWQVSQFFNPDQNAIAAPPDQQPAPNPQDLPLPQAAQFFSPNQNAMAPPAPQPPPAAPAPAAPAPADPMAPHQAQPGAFMPARPVGDLDNVHGLRRALALAFGGLNSFGSGMSGRSGSVLDRWTGQSEAQRTYDANQGRYKEQAEMQAGEHNLANQAKIADIGHTQAETTNLQLNNPMAARKAQFMAQLQTEVESGKYDPVSLKARALRMARAGNVAVDPAEIDDAIQNTKPLGSKYQVSQDKNGRPEFITDRAGNRIFPDKAGKFQDPEAQQQWDAITGAHQQSLSEQEGKEKRVAGYAADRQAAGFAHAEEMANRRFQEQQGKIGNKDTQTRFDTALDADQRLSRMEDAYHKATTNGDQQAMLALLTDHIGMTLGMQKGARITKDILNEATQSQPWLAKVGSKFDSRGMLSGVTLGPEQMKQMLDLGYAARDRSWSSAMDASKMNGGWMPPGATDIYNKRQPGAKPALGQQGGQNANVATASTQQVQQYATEHSISVDQAKKVFTASGIKVQ